MSARLADAAPQPPAGRYWAPRAWLPGGWQEQVLLVTDAHGAWAEVCPGVPADALGPEVQRLAGPVLPGLVNAHSHAFQRAFAGLAEQRAEGEDDFWGWRDRMYRVAGRIGPAALQAVAAQLYAELLRGGYTEVCEFHYLSHPPAGQPGAGDPMAMTQPLLNAAAEVGIGLTLLPVLYERAGFQQPALRADQAGFHRSADDVWALAQHVNQQGHERLRAGLAVHSLRAAAPASLHRLRALAEGFAGPIHIHVAEQTAEVDDCLQATGRRPLQWLVDEGLLDPRWQLVHATHSLSAEVAGVARSGAGVVIAPVTEANLGDGLPDLAGWLAAGVPLSLGSDSQVCRSWREELRWLELGQRLLHRQRNLAAAPAEGWPATAARLWQRVQAGGAAAVGRARWGLQAGARADLLVVDTGDASLLGIPPGQLLDALVFSSPGRPWRDVMVAGRWCVHSHHQAGSAERASRFEAVMAELWGAG